LMKYVGQSKIVEQTLKAVLHFYKAVDLLNTIQGQNNDKEIIKELASCYEITELVARWEQNLLQKAFQVVERVLKQNKNDKSAMICYTHLLFIFPENMELVRNYVEECIKCHPNVTRFKQLRISIYAFFTTLGRSIQICE